MLEVASGSGEHAVYFADAMRGIEWQPSDPDGDALASIEAYRAEYARDADSVNLRAPVRLDATSPDWPVSRADAIVCINMIHISPWEACEGLFAGAAQILGGRSVPVVLYGPFFEADVETAESNRQFDAGLRSRNAQWGIRNVADVDRVAQAHGLSRTARYAMPANNLELVYRTA